MRLFIRMPETALLCGSFFLAFPADGQSQQERDKEFYAKRFAFIRQIEDPSLADGLIQKGLIDPDPLIRQRALYESFSRCGDRAYPGLFALARDENRRVMRTVISCALRLQSPDQKRALLTEIANHNPDPEFRNLARQANFPFFRETQRLKDDPTNDHAIEVVRKFELAGNGWRFMTDPSADGHEKGFFRNDFKDSDWKELQVGTWESQGFPNYDGTAWYRLRFRMPPKIDCKAVEIAFGAIDESAWVWLNGTYVGQHDIGPGGWENPFWLDVRKEIQWGEENLLAVRVKDTAGAGGIWKPVWIEILR